MTFNQKLWIVTGLAIVIALASSARRPAGVASGHRVFGASIAAWIALVAIALLLVGVVSHTLFRHVVQIAPVMVALILLIRRSAVGVAAAVPLFAFWLLIMGGIWLFLLGVARIFTGTFPRGEIALTLIIGSASALGLATAHRQGTSLPFATRLGTVTLFAVLQYAAMWLSVQPYLATR